MATGNLIVEFKVRDGLTPVLNQALWYLWLLTAVRPTEQTWPG